MIREFVMTEQFDESWDNQRLTDDDLRLLQDKLVHNPQLGDVMQGTGGFRKMRHAVPEKGKSGGLRVIYLDIPEFETLYLLLAYPKSEKDNLSNSECNELKQISSNIKSNLQEIKRG